MLKGGQMAYKLGTVGTKVAYESFTYRNISVKLKLQRHMCCRFSSVSDFNVVLGKFQCLKDGFICLVSRTYVSKAFEL